MLDDGETPPAPTELAAPAPTQVAADNATSPEDLACLQAAVDDWQRERADLIRQLQETESRVQREAQLSEQRLREALNQIETLKRTGHAVRARLEAEAQSAHRRAEQADRAREQSQASVEALRTANAELTTAVEAAHCRLADLETERAVLQDAIERLEADRTGDPDRVVSLKAEVVALQWALDAQRIAAEQSHTAATAELAAWRHGHDDELAAWQDIAGQREAELVAAHADLAQQLEQVQAQVDTLQNQAAAAADRMQSLAAELATSVAARTESATQLDRIRAEHEQECGGLRAAAQQREEEHLRALETLQSTLQTAQAALGERLATVEAERDAALRQCTDVEQRLAATIAEHRQIQDKFDRQRQAERNELLGRLSELEQELQHRDNRVSELSGALETLRQEHVTTRDTMAEAAQRREEYWTSCQAHWQSEIDATRQAATELQALLATTQSEAQAVQQQLAAREAEIQQVRSAAEAERDATRQRCAELDEQLRTAIETREQERAGLSAAAQQQEAEQRRAFEALQKTLQSENTDLVERIAAAEAQRHAALQQCAELERQLVAAAEYQEFQTALQRQHDTDRGELQGRLLKLEEELEQRHRRISELTNDLEGSLQKHTEAQRIAAEAAQHHAADYEAERERWQRDMQSLRQAATDTEVLLAATQTRAQELQAQIAAHEAELAEAKADAEAALHLADQQEAARSAVEERYAALQRHNLELAGRLKELQAHNAAQVQAQSEAAAQIGTLEEEREALQVRVEQLTTLAAQLERDCDRVRSERLSAEEARRLTGDNVRLAARIADMERQHSEEAQHHSAAVAGYMVELNQRTEALQERERELQRLTEELALTRQACEDAITQLSGGRQEREELQQQLVELRAAAATGTPRSAGQPGRPVAATSPRPTTSELPATKPPKAAGRNTAMSGPLTVIHLEQNKGFRDAVSDLVGGLPGVQYVNAPEADRDAGKAARLLVVNVLNRTPDPLAAIATAVAGGAEPQDIIGYCADGPHGFVFGPVDFFTAPIDPDACVARLLQSRGSFQRLLAVSENIEVMGTLREAFSRMRCSTSVALDLRQVMDLLTMIDPEVVLIDWALPRGDALHVMSRLRAEPKTRNLPLGILLPTTVNPTELRQHALRAVREHSLSPADLAQTLRQRIGTPAAAENPPAAAQTG